MLLAVISLSCERLFVDDISEEKVELLTPVNNLSTSIITQKFSWSIIDEVDNYRLIVHAIISDTLISVILDTAVTTNEFTYNLLQGNYRWFVKAENYYSTAFSDTFSFVIDSAASIENLLPVLNLPYNQYNNNSTQNFSWNTPQEAEKYRFEIRIGDWEDDQIDTSVILTTKTISTYLPEGVYCWGVQGIFGNIYSGFTYRKITIDLTDPEKPQQDTPEDNSTSTSKDVTLTWNISEDSGSPVFDSLFVSANENFTTIFFSEKSVDGETVVKFINSGQYYWRVRRYDAAGNLSDYSSTRSFTVQ